LKVVDFNSKEEKIQLLPSMLLKFEIGLLLMVADAATFTLNVVSLKLKGYKRKKNTVDIYMPFLNGTVIPF
jgi:hypothetical protein